MKQIQIENGVIRYYGNRVGRVTEGCAVVDPMFQNEALESFLRKQRNIQKNSVAGRDLRPVGK